MIRVYIILGCLWAFACFACSALVNGNFTRQCTKLNERSGAESHSSYIYELKPTVKIIESGQRIKIIAKSLKEVIIKELFLQARSIDLGIPIAGNFSVYDGGMQISCLEYYNDTLLYENTKKKRTIEIQWQPPENYAGNLYFRAAFLSANSAGNYDIIDSRAVTVAGPENEASEFYSLYDDCFETKGCFGVHRKCVDQRSCTTMAIYSVYQNDILFDLLANTNGYVAAAFSTDIYMGNDIGIQCYVDNGKVKSDYIINVQYPEKKSIRVHESNGLRLVGWFYENGWLTCRFFQAAIFTVNNVTYNLLNGSYHLMIASGPVAGSGEIAYHGIHRAVSDAPLVFASPVQVGIASSALVKIHETCMLLAWIGFASTGIIFPRYLKGYWKNIRINGMPVWLFVYRCCLLCTTLLTAIAGIVIFIYLNGWTTVPLSLNPHAVLGCLTVAFLSIQILTALLRTYSNHVYTTIQNCIHWTFGYVTHAFAISTCFFGIRLGKSELSEGVNMILSSFVVIYLIAQIFLTVHKFLSNSGLEKDYSNQGMPPISASENESIQNVGKELHSDVIVTDNVLSNKTIFLQVVISTYLVVTWVLTAVLVMVTSYPQEV